MFNTRSSEQMPWQKNHFSSVTGFTSTLLLKYSRLTRYELSLCWKIIFKLTLWGQALLPKGWICKNTTYGNVRASLAPISNVWNFWSFCNCRTNCYQLVLNFIKQFCLKEALSPAFFENILFYVTSKTRYFWPIFPCRA